MIGRGGHQPGLGEHVEPQGVHPFSRRPSGDTIRDSTSRLFRVHGVHLRRIACIVHPQLSLISRIVVRGAKVLYPRWRGPKGRILLIQESKITKLQTYGYIIRPMRV